MNSFTISGEHITLNQLLKAMGLAQSGGEANEFILAGKVLYNGKTEIRKRKKIFPGDVVTFMGQEYKVFGKME